MKLCVEELIDTKRLVAFISISLLLGVDGGNMACEAIVARAVVFFFPLPYTHSQRRKVVHCGTQELDELREIYWL